MFILFLRNFVHLISTEIVNCHRINVVTLVNAGQLSPRIWVQTSVEPIFLLLFIMYQRN